MKKDIDLLENEQQFAIEKLKRDFAFNIPQHHFHQHYELFYLISGKRCYFINDRAYQINSGDLVLIKEYELHHTINIDDTGYERVLINFNKSFIADAEKLFKDIKISNCFSHQVVRFSERKQRDIEIILEKILKEYDSNNRYSYSYIKILLYELFILILKNSNKEIDFEYPNSMHQKISEIVKYVNVNFSLNLSLDEISQKFFISKYYFCHNFKIVMGLSFTKYLNLIRIKEAERLLRTTKLKINDIIEKTGFESQTHFGRTFRQHTNMSPLQYRKSAIGATKQLKTLNKSD